MGERRDAGTAGADGRRPEPGEFQAAFLSTVAHALRAPLGAIVSYTELIADERERLSPEAAGFLDVVQRAAEQAARLIADLVLLSRIDAGDVRPELTTVPVGEIAADATADAAPAAERSGIALSCQAASGPPARGDPGQVRHLLDYLISNAVQFSGNGDTVQVTAACNDSEWRVEVADSGIGIPEAELSQVFDQFFRASTARAAGRPGAGLGLAVVRALTGLQGGRVEAASKPGDGSRFRVYLPLVPAGTGRSGPARTRAGQATASPAATTGRVLVVDDDPVSARFVMQILGRRAGLEVSHAPDAAAGLARARSEHWDLVLTDLEMPGMSGLDLVTALREISPGLPVAVMTSHPATDAAVREVRDQADEFLPKPIPADRLLTAARSLLAGGRARGEGA